MNIELLSWIVLAFAGLPCALFLINLLVYRPLPRRSPGSAGSSPEHKVSVLIPARNEELNIRATLEAVLANRGCRFEVVVLDDHSTDQTAAIVAGFAARDPRVRLESAPPLPAGWCGKQHACYFLSGLARFPWLVFIDADVRLAPDALERSVSFMEKDRGLNRAFPALASGVPHQQLGTFSERLLLPLIHFILLGYLPMHLMRRTTLPGFSAGCGQLFVIRSDAYRATGGHSRIRATLHDGVKLPRMFRQAGFKTDLFDATDVASCRMYRTNVDTWRGLGKNATEGLAAPGVIGPMTALLLGGQVLPVFLLLCSPWLSTSSIVVAGIAAGLTYLPRLIACARFRQPLGSAWLHPLGVLALLTLQWNALLRHLTGRPAEWKGRQYRPLIRTASQGKAG